MSTEVPNIVQQITDLLNEAYSIRIFDLKKSTLLAKEALVLSRNANEKSLIGKSLNQLALFYMIQGEQAISLKHSEEAIQYFQELNDERGIADAKYAIASTYYKSDNYHLGLVYLIDCLAIYRKYNDYHNQARTLKSMGTIYEYFIDIKNAIKAYKSSIEAAKLANDRNLESNAYCPLSGIYLNQGKVIKAQEMIDSAIRIKRETGDIRGLAFALYGRGKVSTHKGNYKEAEADFVESININLEMNERLGIGMSYYKLGALYIKMNELEKAKEILSTGIQSAEKYNVVIIKFKCYFLMYEIFKMENNIEKALHYLEIYLKTKEQVINSQTSKIIENYELIKKMETLERDAEIQKEKAEIIEKTNKAEQSAKVRQEFLSTMSHEIRTPLNAVITISSLLQDNATSEQKVLVESLGFASNNLMMIINDILDFTKLDTNNVKLDFRPIEFGALMKNLRGMYDETAKIKDLHLNLFVGVDVGNSYQLDGTKLTQILSNLISNGIKYTKNGNVTIEVKKVSEDETHDTLRFSVKDTGVGIPTKHFEEIFESFSQPKSITTRTEGGTGLGLAIVKKLVELYGSKIELKSREKSGSEFYFELKLKRTKSITSKSDKPTNVLIGKSILIVDDNMINALVASKLLIKWGLSTDHAVNGREAILKSNVKKFDFILMDIHMPLMDGYESCDRIRNSEGLNKETPIFALTADVTAESHPKYNDNFNGLLIKPLEIMKLHDMLVSVYDK
jgi:signal transduction histidine kinase